MELVIRDLKKSFNGVEVLHGISFSIHSGKALGLLGRNGAGKSTTIRILMDVFKANAGSIMIDGKKFNPKQYKIGYLPEERGLYPKKKVNEQLIYLAQLRGCSKQEAKNNLQYYLKRLNIEEYEQRVLDTLSKGNQQKVQLIQTLICNPDIIILDEPFSGLDPVNAQLLKDVVMEEIQKGKLVIFSSHQMNFVEEFCEDIVILHKGEVVLNGNLKQIKKEYGKNRLVLKGVTCSSKQLQEILESKYNDFVKVIQEYDDGILLELKNDTTSQYILEIMVKEKIDLEKFYIYEASLTDIFIEKAGDAV